MPSLEEQLCAFAKTPRFKQLCNDAKKSCKQAGKRFGQPGSGLTLVEARRCAENMAQILRNEVSEIRNAYGEPFLDHIEVGDPIRNPDGSYQANVWFNRAAMHRDSLWEEGYPNGLENIALLFAKGYNASASVYGKNSHGTWVKSLTHRDANDFMSRAVEIFNDVMAGQAVATVDQSYL